MPGRDVLHRVGDGLDMVRRDARVPRKAYIDTDRMAVARGAVPECELKGVVTCEMDSLVENAESFQQRSAADLFANTDQSDSRQHGLRAMTQSKIFDRPDSLAQHRRRDSSSDRELEEVEDRDRQGGEVVGERTGSRDDDQIRVVHRGQEVLELTGGPPLHPPLQAQGVLRDGRKSTTNSVL